MPEVTDLFAYDAWPSRQQLDWFQAGRGELADDNLDFHVDLGCGRVPKGRIGVDRYPAEGVAVVADLDRGGVFAVAPEPGRDAVDVVGRQGHRVDRHYTGGLARWGDPKDPGPDYYDYPQGSGYERKILPLLPWNHSGGPRRLPFADGSIESMISHHCLEHIGAGFIGLMDEIWRVLRDGALFRAIVPLFPSWSAVSDPDHKRYFCADDASCTFDTFCGKPGEPHWMDSFSVPYTAARFTRTNLVSSPDSPDPWTSTDAREIRVSLIANKPQLES